MDQRQRKQHSTDKEIRYLCVLLTDIQPDYVEYQYLTGDKKDVLKRKKHAANLQRQMLDLDSLQVDQYYHIGCFNRLADSGKEDWYWFEALPVSKQACYDLFKYRKSLPDFDREVPIGLSDSIITFGYPEGWEFYTLAREHSDSNEPTRSEILAVAYEHKQRVKRKTAKLLEQYFQQKFAQEIINFEPDEESD